jgi:hypothetical protein
MNRLSPRHIRKSFGSQTILLKGITNFPLKVNQGENVTEESEVVTALDV